MAKLRLMNLKSLDFGGYRNYFSSFTVGMYTFKSVHDSENARQVEQTSRDSLRHMRTHEQNAYVEFSGKQEDSILFKNGRVGTSGSMTQKRKIIDDILILGSLLTGYNWQLHSRMKTLNFPLVVHNGLTKVSYSNTLGEDLSLLLAKIKTPHWQERFDNGFHLIMFLNASNIRVREWRFLSKMVIWEFIYAKLFDAESNDLNHIMKETIRYYWPSRSQNLDVLFPTTKKNILCVLRNQLAHSGRLPINRPYAPAWMRQIPAYNSTDVPQTTLENYIDFFDELTHVVILKTLDFDIESRGAFGSIHFQSTLESFLTTGEC